MTLAISETQLLDAIRDVAAWHEWLCYHTYDSRRSEAGFPDLVLVRGSRLLFVECKSERGWVRPEQRRWLEALGAIGGPQFGFDERGVVVGPRLPEVYVWRPADWRDGTIETVLA